MQMPTEIFFLSRKDPSIVESQYRIALQDLRNTTNSAELRSLLHGFHGLAMQYYRLGLVALEQSDSVKAKEYLNDAVFYGS